MNQTFSSVGGGKTNTMLVIEAKKFNETFNSEMTQKRGKAHSELRSDHILKG